MADHELLQFFTFEHLPEHLRKVSEPFCLLARELADMHPAVLWMDGSALISSRMAEWERGPLANVEATFTGTKLEAARGVVSPNSAAVPAYIAASHSSRLDRALRFVLEAKDCAVRAVLYKPVSP